MICDYKPDAVIEIGNFHGGSTLALTHILDVLGKGRIIGVDIDQSEISSIVKSHKRITLIEGDAVKLFEKVNSLISNDEKVLIIEDSSHTYDNTLKILRLYSQLIKKGGFFIVEDGICYHGLNLGPKPGPYEAVNTFLKENKKFVSDRSKESFLITWNPNGFLKRL